MVMAVTVPCSPSSELGGGASLHVIARALTERRRLAGVAGQRLLCDGRGGGRVYAPDGSGRHPSGQGESQRHDGRPASPSEPI